MEIFYSFVHGFVWLCNIKDQKKKNNNGEEKLHWI